MAHDEVHHVLGAAATLFGPTQHAVGADENQSFVVHLILVKFVEKFVVFLTLFLVDGLRGEN